MAQRESILLCDQGTLDITRSLFEQGFVKATDCQTTIRQSRFHRTRDPILEIRGGKPVIENNLFTNGYELADSLLIRGIGAGSLFRFNTVVNTSGAIEEGVALECDGTLEVSSNIFAYRSTRPFGPTAGCLAKFSVFDDLATFATPPVDSKLVPFSAIFVNGANDFRISATSPAKGAADPAISDVLSDIDGNSRPNPLGTMADCGSFEAP